MTTLGEILDHTPLDFGKHKGKTPDQIAESDPSYVVWMFHNVDPVPCSAALAKACEQDLDDDRDDEPEPDRFWGDL